MTYDDIGSDEDLRADYRARQVTRAWESAEALMAAASAPLTTNPRNTVVRRAERRAREALGWFASALNWAEDGRFEAEAHERMDEAGRWVRETFGCTLHQEGFAYMQTCPVALGHNRIGMSVGGYAKRICSLCGLDVSDCEHLRGRAYLVPGGADDLGWCRVCTSRDGCDHNETEMYRAGVVAIITEMRLDEVSVVGKPAHPDARFTSVPIDGSQLQAHLGAEWSPGMAVNCDRCLTACGGLTRHPAAHL